MSETAQVTGAAQATTDAAPASSVAAASTPAVATPAAASTPAAAQQLQEPAATAPAEAAPDATKVAEVKPPKVVPEQYADFKLPEGHQADVELTTEFKSVAKELGLSQEEAQKVNDIGAKMMSKIATQQQENAKAVRDSWDAATRSDKEFGGDKLKQSIATAEKALNAFGTPELFKLLDDSGLRKHPEIIRMLFKAGNAISDDRMIPSGQRTSQGGVDAAKALYPKT